MKAIESALCWNMLAAVIECFTISTPVGSLTTQLMMTKNCADALHGYRSLEMRMLPHMLSIRFRSLPGLRPKMAGLWIRNPESSKTPETSGGPSFGLLHIGKARQLRRNTHRSACSRRSQMGGQDGSHKPNPCCRKASNCARSLSAPPGPPLARIGQVPRRAVMPKRGSTALGRPEILVRQR